MQFPENFERRTAVQIPASKRVYDVVSKVAYLIGVSEGICERTPLKFEIFEEMHAQSKARTIRTLSVIRCALMRYYDGVAYGMYNMKNLDRLHEFFNPEWFDYLVRQGIPFIKTNYKVGAYIADANRYLTENIAGCRELFPNWLEWNYLKGLFLMPDGAKETGIRKAIADYSSNLNAYPFQMYLNLSPADQGNILLHDGKFIHLLYQAHGQRFTDLNKIEDASTGIKDGLQEFIATKEAIVLMVDCENSDPYKFCAAIRSIAAHCGDDITHIRKIVLFDDVHSATAWSILHQYINIPIERKLIRRVVGRKSLVDISLAADACKEVYKNGADALIIASSDSDFWGLITALTDATFYIMVEYEKCGEALKVKLAEANVPYCLMDSFTSGGISDLKEGTLMAEVCASLEMSVHLNIPSMLEVAYSRARIPMSEAERQNFESKLLRKLRLKIDGNGDVGIVV